MRIKSIALICSILFGFTASAASTTLTNRPTLRQKPNLIIGGTTSVISVYNTDLNKKTDGTNVDVNSFVPLNYDFYVGSYVNRHFRIEAHFGQRLQAKAKSKMYTIGNKYNWKGELEYTMDLNSTFGSFDFLWELSPYSQKSSFLLGAGVAYTHFEIKDIVETGVKEVTHYNPFGVPYKTYENDDLHIDGESKNNFSLKLIAAVGLEIAKNLSFTSRIDAYVGNTLKTKSKNPFLKLNKDEITINPVDIKFGLEYALR